MRIITTLDQCGASEYAVLLGTITRWAASVERLRITAITGDLEPETRAMLEPRVHELLHFEEFQTTRDFAPFLPHLGHPIGKFAKLFFALEHLHDADDDDTVLFLDPDTYVQRPLNELERLASGGVLLFGYQFQNIHHTFRPNARLAVADAFDTPGPWRASYFYELNTGVILGTVRAFKNAIAPFREFVFQSEYLRSVDNMFINHWHDQDFFRYYLRKTLPIDIGTLGLEHVFTTTHGAAHCLCYDPVHSRYITAWGIVPYVVHLAGGTISKIPWKHEFMRPPQQPRQASSSPKSSFMKRILDLSPLDIMRLARKRIGRFLG